MHADSNEETVEDWEDCVSKRSVAVYKRLSDGDVQEDRRTTVKAMACTVFCRTNEIGAMAGWLAVKRGVTEAGLKRMRH